MAPPPVGDSDSDASSASFQVEESGDEAPPVPAPKPPKATAASAALSAATAPAAQSAKKKLRAATNAIGVANAMAQHAATAASSQHSQSAMSATASNALSAAASLRASASKDLAATAATLSRKGDLGGLRNGSPAATPASAAPASKGLTSPASALAGPTPREPPVLRPNPNLATPQQLQPASLRQVFASQLSETPVALATTSASGEPLPPFSFAEHPTEEFENELAPEASTYTEVRKIEVPREQGRCLGPVRGEPGGLPDANSFAKFQIDFFKSKQTVVAPSDDLTEIAANAIAGCTALGGPARGVVRDIKLKGQLVTSMAVFNHELSGANQDAAALRRAASETPMVPADLVESNASTAVRAALTKYSTCDVLQLYDAARDLKPLVPPTMGKIWTYDYEPRHPAPMPKAFSNGVLYMIDVKKCETTLQSLHGKDVEPTFGSLSVHKISDTECVKLTETFWFDVNASKNTLFMTKQSHPSQLLSKCGVFIPHEFRGSKLFLVMRLYRLATDDHKDAMDMYIRPGAWAAKHFPPHSDKLKQYAATTDITTEVAWCALSLIATNGSLFQGTSGIEELYVNPRFGCTSDANLYDFMLNDAKRNKLKRVNAAIVVECKDISTYDVAVPHYDPTETAPVEEEVLLAAHDPAAGPTAPRTQLRFCPTIFSVLPAGFYNTYYNVMYVRLKSLNLTRLAHKTVHPLKHYAIKVALKDQDDDLTIAEGMQSVYARRFHGAIVATSGWSTVNVDIKDAEFSDEFKIQLPAMLTEKHHLMFTIYGIPFDRRAGVQDPIPVGYAVLPIFPNKMILVKDPVQLAVMLADGSCNAARNGYLTKVEQLAKACYVGDKSPVFDVSTSVRSTVYSAHQATAEILGDMGNITKFVTDTGRGNILETSGKVRAHKVETQSEQRLSKTVMTIEKLPPAEKLVYYPAWASLLLAIVSSPSYNVGAEARGRAFQAFTTVTHAVHQFNMSRTTASGTAAQRMASSSMSLNIGNPKQAPQVTVTCPIMMLYHYLTNDLFYDDSCQFDIARAVAELYPAELRRSSMKVELKTYRSTLGNFLWLFYDLILKSVYLRANTRKPPPPPKPAKKKATLGMPEKPTVVPANLWVLPNRNELYDESFYVSVGQLVTEVIRQFAEQENATVVMRTSLFLRHLALVADRGMVLTILRNFLRQLSEKNTRNVDVALRTFLDGELSVVSLVGVPTVIDLSPRGITFVALRRLIPLVFNKVRSVRESALINLTAWVSRSTRQQRLVTNDTIVTLACSLFGLIPVLCEHYAGLRNTVNAASSPTVPMQHTGGSGQQQPASPTAFNAENAPERRLLLVLVMWIFQNLPQLALVSYIGSITEFRVLNGLVLLIKDALQTFKYAPQTAKLLTGAQLPSPNQRGPTSPSMPPPNQQALQELLPWDSRLEAMVLSISIRVMSIMVSEQKRLRDVGSDEPHSAIYNFFEALSLAVDISAPSAVLQAGCCLLRQTIDALCPEILSGRGVVVPDLVFDLVRLMTSASPPVRDMASQTFLLFARRHFELQGNLSKFQIVAATAMVRIADTEGRDLNLAGEYMAHGLAALVDVAGDSWTQLPTDVRSRYTPPGASVEEQVKASGLSPTHGDAAQTMSTAMKRETKVRQFPCTTQDVFKLPAGIETARKALLTSSDSPDFATQFERLADKGSQLFTSVVKLQSGAAVAFKEVKCLAYLDVVRTFLAQRSLVDAVHWLRRLMEVHRQAGDFVEAGMCSITMAALVFRSTQMYYHVFGAAGTGARIPYAVVTQYMHWHDFLRVMPGLDDFIPEETMYLAVAEQVTLPETRYFTLDGLYTLLREGADFLAKGLVFELAVLVLTCVQQLCLSKDDHKTMATIAEMTAKYSINIADAKDVRRLRSKYFALNVFGGAMTDPVQWVFRYPHHSSMDLSNFQRLGTELAVAVVGCNAEDIVLSEYKNTDDVVKATEAASAAAAASASLKSRRGKKKAIAAVTQKVFVTCHEVLPYFEENDTRINGKPFDRFLNIDRFSFAVRVTDPNAIDQMAKVVLTRAQAQQMSEEALRLDVLAQRLRVVVHQTERYFPSLTIAVPVARSEESTLDPLATALDTVDQQQRELMALQDNVEPAKFLLLVDKALTLEGAIRPGGYYFKEVLRVFGHEPEVLEAMKAFLGVLKVKVDKCAAAAARAPERFAAVVKASIDIECAIEATRDRPAPAAEEESEEEGSYAPIPVVPAKRRGKDEDLNATLPRDASMAQQSSSDVQGGSGEHPDADAELDDEEEEEEYEEEEEDDE
jgi:hypothetical protein